MTMTNDTGKMPPATSTLSISWLATELRSQLGAQYRFHADRLAELGDVIERLDAGLMTVQTDSSASEQQALIGIGVEACSLLHGDRPGHADCSRIFTPEYVQADLQADLQAERAIKLRQAIAYLQSGAELPSMATMASWSIGGAPW